jgi:hypothetical protein
MKAKQLIWMVLALLIQTAIAKAQVKDSIVYQNHTYEVVREGNLTYLKYNYRTMERLETIDRKRQTYENVSFSFHPKKFYDSLFRSVFSEEREKQLAGKILSCHIVFDPVQNEIMHIQFIMPGMKEGDAFPLKLSELDTLERKFRETPDLFDYESFGKKRDGGERLRIPYSFGISDE